MRKKPAQQAAVEEQLSKKLRDPDVDVRMGALSRLIELATENPSAVTAETFREMGERVKDKKPEVRKLALVGLARLYHRHVSSTLPPLDYLYAAPAAGKARGGSSSSSSSVSQSQGSPAGLAAGGHDGDDDSASSAQHGVFASVVRKELLDKLGTVPHIVINSWGYPDMKPTVLTLLQENLLPKTIASRVVDDEDATEPLASQSQEQSQSQSQKGGKGGRASHGGRKGKGGKDHDDVDATRVTALLLLFTLLDPPDRSFLGTILSHKAKVRSEGSTPYLIQSLSNPIPI